MTQLVKSPRLQNYFPLTLDECETFGWGSDPATTVMSSRTPCGRRLIPTRQQSSSGDYFYGVIVTGEPPPGISEKLWLVIMDEINDEVFVTQ